MTGPRKRRVVKLEESRILKRKDITPDIWLIWIEKPEGYAFKPGQYCTIGVDGIERAYSIVSAPYEDSLELFIELVPKDDGGVLTPELYKLNPGDKVSIRPRAKGIFTFNPDFTNHLLVSTVTGVVPYVSYLRDYINDSRNDHKFYFLMGASYHDEFSYDSELRQMESEHPGMITFVPTISRPSEERNKNWEGDTGRVNTIVEKYIETFKLTSSDTLIYACGHPGMIEDVKARMTPKGWTVQEERFWKED